MRILLAILVALYCDLSFAQPSATVADIFPGPEWFQGSILLNSGKELQGLLKYNDKTDIVCYERGRDSRSYTARSVKAFEFFDEIEKEQRIFYAVPVEDRKHNVMRPLFFEVVMDLENFAVLSKFAPIRFDKRDYSTPAMFNPATGSFVAGRYYGYPATVTHTETLFILAKNGSVNPFLQIIEKEIDGAFFDRSKVKNKVLDENLLKMFTAPHYPQLLSFAKKHNLSFAEKKDLIAILEYYAQLDRN